MVLETKVLESSKLGMLFSTKGVSLSDTVLETCDVEASASAALGLELWGQHNEWTVHGERQRLTCPSS